MRIASTKPSLLASERVEEGSMSSTSGSGRICSVVGLTSTSETGRPRSETEPSACGYLVVTLCT